MKSLSRLSFVASFVVALTLPGRAQVLTDSTITGFDAATAFSSGFALTPDFAATQTFSDITSIESATFRFIANVGDSITATNLTYTFGQWDGNNGTFSIGPPTQTIAIDNNTAWTTSGSYIYFDASLDLSAFATGLSAANTYGLSFFGNADNSSNLRLAGASTPYADGGGFTHFAPTDAFGNLFVGGAAFANDFAFEASSSLAAVPEASSVAVLFAGAFVGSLMLRRQRRQPIPLEA